MRKLWYKFLSVIEVLRMILIPLLISNVVIFLIGWFITFDFNPLNWWLLNCTYGRVVTVIFELIILTNIPKFWDEFD